MKHTYFSISDASKKLGVESHVLRYWEEELGLSVPRNEQGHRFYDDDNLATFTYISELREDGYSLQEIRDILSDNSPSYPVQKPKNSIRKHNSLPENPDKLDKFREIMNSIISQAITDNNEQLASMICTSTSERIMKEMNYLFRTLDEDEETRHKQLEAAIFASVKTKKQIAATKTPGKKRHFFKNKTGDSEI